MTMLGVEWRLTSDSVLCPLASDAWLEKYTVAEKQT